MRARDNAGSGENGACPKGCGPTPVFSVVIPTYNYAEHLGTAIRSVLEQEPHAPQCIVVDDGSTDHTPVTIAALQEEFPELLTFRQDNAGPGAARNFGAKQANGSWLVFLDSDDALLPGAIAALTHTASVHPHAEFLVGDHISVTDGKEKLQRAGTPSSDRAQAFRDFLLNRTLSLNNGAVAVKRITFARYGYATRFRNGEDIALFAKLLANHEGARTDAALVRRLRHGDSLRHNAEAYRKTATEVVEEIFDDPQLPSSLQRYRKPFLARRWLSLARQLYDIKDYAGCRSTYLKALRVDLPTALRGSYKFKALKACFK